MISINRVKIINQEQADEVYRRLPQATKLIFAIGLETGLRISDILRIKYGDITNPMRVYVGRDATIYPYPISEWLYGELISLSYYSLLGEYIFHSRRRWGRSIHRTTYHRHIKKAIDGLDFDCSAHSTRRFYLIKNDLLG